MNTLKKAQKKLSVTLNKARKDLTSRGIQARKDKKARIERLREVEARGDLPEPELLRLIRQPNKNLIVVE